LFYFTPFGIYSLFFPFRVLIDLTFAILIATPFQLFTGFEIHFALPYRLPLSLLSVFQSMYHYCYGLDFGFLSVIVAHLYFKASLSDFEAVAPEFLHSVALYSLVLLFPLAPTLFSHKYLPFALMARTPLLSIPRLLDS